MSRKRKLPPGSGRRDRQARAQGAAEPTPRPESPQHGPALIGKVRGSLRSRHDQGGILHTRLRLWQWALIFGGLYGVYRGIRHLLGL
jgi:hypothetical protein